MNSSLSRRTQFPSLRPLAAALLAVMALASLPSQATVATGAMTAPRMMHQASAMLDGRVLFSGGFARPGSAPYASAEIYDPATGLFTAVAPMLQARTWHAAATLNDGRILVMGGAIVTSPGVVGTNTAELYDPASGLWSATGNLNVARVEPIALVLPDGKVFVMKADANSNTPYAEVYDPQTGVFTKTGNMLELSGQHGLLALADGRVMKLGGYVPGSASVYSKRVEIWDPATNLWTATGSMAELRNEIKPMLLPDGKVLVAGGSNTSTLKTTEIYDPATGLFTPGNPMPEFVRPDSGTLLPNGNVVLTGPYTKSLFHYETATGVWNATGPKRSAARETTVTRLADGNLLLAGGAAENDATAYAVIWDQACAPQKLALSAAAQVAAADGGQVSWTVTGAPGCRFEVTGLPAWLTAATSGPLQMPATGILPVSFTAVANASTATRAASFMLGNNMATVTQAPSPSCPATPVVSPASFAFTSAARTGVISVSAVESCPWTISVLPSWVTPTSAVSGKGNGSVGYSVPANMGPARSGNGQLDALGLTRSFTMSQDAPPLCPSAPVLTPNSVVVAPGASSGIINVSAAATCPWSVASAAGWVTVPGAASGTGNGSFSYSVAPNTGVGRIGSGSVTGPGVSSTFHVTQTAGECASWSVTPTSSNFPAGATTGSFAVTAASTCNWSLSALPNWMGATSSTSGSGNGSISYTVAANTGAARSASALLSGAGPTLSLSMNQAPVPAAPCSSPIASGAPVNAVLQANNCGVGARGAGYHTDRYTFSGVPGQQVTILLTSPAFDTYLYLKNPAGTVIKSDDDGGGGYNSRIPASTGSFTLPAGSSGTYTIEVSSYGQYRTGAYTLSLTQ